jgi:hypothetical protein
METLARDLLVNQVRPARNHPDWVEANLMKQLDL